jgi:L-lactate dehydrogenase complex protein LldF
MSASTSKHPRLAAIFVRDDERAHWHDESLWFVRTKRDRAAASVPEWETLRDTASAIKAHTISNLANYLEEFERNATALGAKIHWARNAAEHNEIVRDILRDHGIKKVVKSKSMLTEECHLNPYLERHGFEVIDTDLGERIVQMAQEPPSHIVLPAIHKKKSDVGDIFHKHLGTEAGATDPQYLAEAARGHMREKFLQADVGITGVNFAIAETGGFVVCTNEGNADLGASLPKLHIACMGLEKLIPKAEDLGVFIRLLGRSATGQAMTTYTSHFHGPAPDGELHIVIVDNGRADILDDALFRQSLHCIRCGACMNTCPVYRRSGGHSYAATVPGPIGSVLEPLREPEKHASLPHACSLCGSCGDVCPVKIPLPEQLLTFRRDLARKGLVAWHKRVGLWCASFVMKRPWMFATAGWFARKIVPWTPRFLVYQNWLNPWGKQREIPEFPKTSFRDQYRRRRSPTSNRPHDDQHTEHGSQHKSGKHSEGRTHEERAAGAAS